MRGTFHIRRQESPIIRKPMGNSSPIIRKPTSPKWQLNLPKKKSGQAPWAIQKSLLSGPWRHSCSVHSSYIGSKHWLQTMEFNSKIEVDHLDTEVAPAS